MDEREIERIVASVVASARAQSTQSAQSTTGDITLDAALKLAQIIKSKAREIGVNAAIAICDSHAAPVLTECMDGYLLAAFDIAFNKAYTCASLRMSTSKLKTLAQPGGSLYGIQHTNGGKIVIFGGGEPLCTGETVVGGLGVSGGTEEQDTFLAKYGSDMFRKG